MINKRLIKDKR